MTLQELASVADIVASVAVIGSLIYLARQVSQNTETMRVNASQAWTNLNFDLSNPVATDRVVAELWVKGDSEFQDLDVVDQQRLVMYEWRALEAWHHLFEMHQRGVLPESQWAKLKWIVENLGKRQAIRAAWNQFRDAYDGEYQEFIDSRLL